MGEGVDRQTGEGVDKYEGEGVDNLPLLEGCGVGDTKCVAESHGYLLIR